MTFSFSGGRNMRPGTVTSYIHPGGEIVVLVEVSCESESVTKSDGFQEFVHDVAMQIAASCPKFIRKEHVSRKVLDQERKRYRLEAAATGKPGPVVAKIVEGKVHKYYEEVCLYQQPFIKDRSISISQLIASRVAELGEKIRVRRFARINVGESDLTMASDSDPGPEDGEETGVTVNRPKAPKGGIGFAVAKPDAE
jgi:elongation factor Ts